MTKRFILRSVLCAILLVLVAGGCQKRESSNVPTDTPISVSSLVDDGWGNYSAGNFDAALQSFSTAAARDATALEAYLGIGWASIELGLLDQARGNLENVISLVKLPDLGYSAAMVQILTNESTAGLAQVELAVGNYAAAYSKADSVITRNPTFAMRRVSRINWRQMTLIKADAAMYQSKFSLALAAVTQLDSTLANNAAVLARTTRTLTATTMSTTTSTGQIQFTIPDPALAMVATVEDTSRLVGGVPMRLPVYSTTDGQSTFIAIASPIPADGAPYRVTYYRTDVYATFLAHLRELIRTLRG